MRRLPFIAILALLVAAPAPAAAACKNADKRPTTTTIGDAQRATMCLVNAERTRRGLAALRTSSALTRAARGHSLDMVRRDYFDHTSPGGGTPGDRATDAGYEWRTVGENIAWGGGRLATPRTMVRLWMDSPGHKANILNRSYHDAGVGVAAGTPSGGGSGGTFTQLFGAR